MGPAVKRRLQSLARIGAPGWPWFRPRGTIRADPNPVWVEGPLRVGSTALSWRSRGTQSVEVRVGAPDGPLLSRSGPCGQAATGNWVRSGTSFYLQNVSGGLPLTQDGTLDLVEVRVVSADDRAARAARGVLDRAVARLLSTGIPRRVERVFQRAGGSLDVGEAFFGNLRRLQPVSTDWGSDRGTPIDRYYLERFLGEHSASIRGRVLEIGDDRYTRQFGGDRVVRSDVLHVLQGQPGVTIVADLTRGDDLPSDTFDCIVCAQTLQYIYEVRAALRHLGRILKPGGTLLASANGIGKTGCHAGADPWGEYWHFTAQSLEKLLAEAFPPENVRVRACGNVLAAAAFLYGLAAEELEEKELNYTDPDYEVVLLVQAQKPL